ncbi:UMP kinase, partial [bacterium]|nr:UMP kinase [bacterium]
MADESTPLKYKRILLKISGESFCRDRQGGISMTEITRVAEDIRDVVNQGVELAIVCGGGNILRGKQFSDGSNAIKTATAHYM